MMKAHTGLRAIRRGALGGFTLIELLVVIAIIAIIASISLLVAGRVTEGGRTEQTRSILKTMDQMLTQYSADKDGGKFPYKYTDETTQKNEYPIVDGRLDSASVDRTALPEPTTQLFLLASGESASLLSMVNGIEGTFKDADGKRGRIVESQNVVSYAFGTAGTTVMRADGSTPAKAALVRDPWGNAIRYVHPKFAGGHGDFFKQSAGSWSSQSRPNLSVKVKRNGSDTTLDFRRSYRPWNPDPAPAGITPVGDADEGIGAGSRPYFYSAGPDGDPGTRDDNVYTDAPAFPSETKSAN
jgi:prepilin-type N-terminal cleavage/methylation domain-containing protein